MAWKETAMIDRTLRNLEQSGVVPHRDGSVTTNGTRHAPPPAPPATPSIPDQLAALKARLLKGGDWIDAEDAWLKTHKNDPDWARRNVEFDRQLARYADMLNEFGVLEASL